MRLINVHTLGLSLLACPNCWLLFSHARASPNISSMNQSSSAVQAMELEEFQLLERQLSHETGGPHARPLQIGVSPQGQAAKSQGLPPISQPDNAAEDAPSGGDMMAQGSNPSSNASRIGPSLPSGNMPGHLFQHQAGLPHAPSIALGSLDSAQRPAFPESIHAEGLSDVAPEQRQQQHQASQQPGQLEVSAHIAASMTDQGTFPSQSPAYAAQELLAWRERADWAGPHRHAAVASTAPGASMPHDRDFMAASSPKLYGSLQDEVRQQQRGSVAESDVLHEGHACSQTEATAIRLDNPGAMGISRESLRQGQAAQVLDDHAEKDCGMAGATQQVSR